MHGRQTSEQWSRNRSAISHDWLSAKHFIGRVSRLLRAVEGSVEGSESELSQIQKLRSEWFQGRHAIEDLINGLELAMSPNAALDRYPLRLLPNERREWIGKLIHRLWLRRCHVFELMVEARVQLKAADDEFSGILATTNNLSIGSESERDLSASRLSALLATMHRLHSAVARFPARIKTT